MNGDDRSRTLLHDTAACYRFVKSTAAACKLSSGFPSYLEPTKKLLAHIHELSVSTQKFLSNFPSANLDNPVEHRSRRQLLTLVRSTWKGLHAYVQPAVDADTLNVPTALIGLIAKQVRLIDECEMLEFALIHTDKLNYFQFPPGDFEKNVTDLGDVVAPHLEFPPDLGLIALPHSQAQHLFLNGLLAHEIGHIVFARLDCLDRIAGAISAGFQAAFDPAAAAALSAQELKGLPEVLQDWSEELFCDLFGVYLLGPSFVLASIEFFDLSGILAADGTIDEKAARSHFKFERNHPAHLFRLWRQATLLEKLGWWEGIHKCKSHHIRLIERCLELRPSSFAFDTRWGSEVIDAFSRTIDSIEGEVARVTKNLRNRKGRAREIAEFAKLKDLISTYLSHAIVPSTLYVGRRFKKPTGIVLLNAAHLFYLSGIEDLISKSDETDETRIDKRDIWMERVENWTTKGLEDISLPDDGGA